jgi:CRISPR-associated endonuclease/helicase Cas3
VYVFEPETEFIKRTPTYIKQTADVARSILRDFNEDPTSIKAINAYFKLLYTVLDGKRAFDAKEILACYDRSDGFDFKKAAEKFNLIDNITVAVVVPYNKTAGRFIKELEYNLYPTAILRKLQSYTVNIYEQEFQALNEKGVIEMAADAYAVLNDMSFYNAQTGIVIPARDSGKAIFFD